MSETESGWPGAEAGRILGRHIEEHRSQPTASPAGGGEVEWHRDEAFCDGYEAGLRLRAEELAANKRLLDAAHVELTRLRTALAAAERLLPPEGCRWVAVAVELLAQMGEWSDPVLVKVVPVDERQVMITVSRYTPDQSAAERAGAERFRHEIIARIGSGDYQWPTHLVALDVTLAAIHAALFPPPGAEKGETPQLAPNQDVGP